MIGDDLCGEFGCAPYGAEGLDVDCTRPRGHHGDHRIDLGDLGDYTWPLRRLGPITRPWWWDGGKPVTIQDTLMSLYQRHIELALSYQPLQKGLPGP